MKAMKSLQWLFLLMRHPLTKRISLAVPVYAGMAIVLSLLGWEQSVFMGLITGFSAFAFVDLALCDRDARNKRWSQATRFLKDNWGSATSMAALLVVMCLAYSHRQDPVEPLVQQVLAMVEILGLLAVTVVPPIRNVLLTTTAGAWHTVGSLVRQLVWGLAAYALALWLIGAAGDDVYRWVSANPNDAVVTAASLTVCWAILHIGYSPAATTTVAMASAVCLPALTRKPTARDNRYTAAHEAGHALVFAALGGLPEYVRLVVHEHADEDGTLGFVTGIRSAHQLDEKSFAEWYMLVFLAGKLGESVMHGGSTLGSGHDHLRWLGVARSYLANHYCGMYYAEPQNKFEQEQNEVKLEALQTEQLELLRSLFDLNAEVFKELAETLLEKRMMNRDDLTPFLSRAKLPDGFPLPFGPFIEFGATIPGSSSY